MLLLITQGKTKHRRLLFLESRARKRVSHQGRRGGKETPPSLSVAFICSCSSLRQYVKLWAHSQWKDWTCGILNRVEQWRPPSLECKCRFLSLVQDKEQDKRFTAKRQFSYRSGPNIRLGSLVYVLQFLMSHWSDVCDDPGIVILSPNCRNPVRRRRMMIIIIVIIVIPHQTFIRSISRKCVIIFNLLAYSQEG